MNTLAGFQNDFARALLSPQPATALGSLTAQPGFAVYRNTVIKGCVDAIAANYPAVTRLVGEAWLRAAASVYVREALPGDPALIRYGDSFPEFLARFEPAQQLPYLPGVARLDRLWREAHTARDDPLLDPEALARLAPAALAAVVLYPHAAARWAWFEHAPIFSIWSRNREAAPLTDAWEPRWKAEGALLTRAHGNVEWRALDAAGFALLEACANGGTLAQATAAALGADSHASLEQTMTLLLHAGAFSRFSITRWR